MTDDAPMTSTPGESLFPCPVCDSCDHDLRAGFLDLITNVTDNFKAASEKVIDGMEADGDGKAEFAEAVFELASVRSQIGALMAVIPDIAVIKSANTEKAE